MLKHLKFHQSVHWGGTAPPTTTISTLRLAFRLPMDESDLAMQWRDRILGKLTAKFIGYR
jgi:hypothetical protein